MTKATQPGKEPLGLRPGHPTQLVLLPPTTLPAGMRLLGEGWTGGLTQMQVLLSKARMSECSAPAQGAKES